MTLMKEKAVEMIRRMPEDNMAYVINILQNLEAMYKNRDEDKKRARIALSEVLSMEKRLPDDFDPEKSLEKRGQKSMNILVDANIILDVLLKREPHNKAAQAIMTKCADREITGYLAANSIPNIFYVLRKEYS